jgi:hypothetical protein
MAKPIFPEEKLPTKRTGSIFSKVGPAVIRIVLLLSFFFYPRKTDSVFGQ